MFYECGLDALGIFYLLFIKKNHWLYYIFFFYVYIYGFG